MTLSTQPRLALIHSPLVGPSSWRLTERAIHQAGGAALAVDYGGVAGPDWYAGATARIAAHLVGEQRIVVVAHSGAGAFLPGLVDALGDRLIGPILADAVMPYPGRCWFDTAAPELCERVRGLESDGVLPPWDTWWGPDAMTRLIQDEAMRAAFIADLPRLPLAYFEARAPAGDGWRTKPGAYLQLSEACAEDAQAARGLGWLVRREALHHLAMLTHPDRLAAILMSMARELAAD